ncbi:MAG: class I SAM-dependent methyltransferase [Cyclobacteriaceae bacterium]|nr:class I SAM-dependent methyltransferase [Cyclobacteriaceae bacterium]
MLYSHEVIRIHGFVSLLASLDKVQGDIVECGVGRGRFLTVFVYANTFYKLNKKVYGFDSFEGFPVASPEDFGTRVVKTEKISGWDDVTPEMIQYVVQSDQDGEGSRSIGNSVKDVILVKGFFNQTLSYNLPDKIAFLHLDADLYESTRDALTHCLPRMVKGSIIVFDELHEKEKWPGVAKAVDEICTPQNLVPEWDAVLQRFVIKVQ